MPSNNNLPIFGGQCGTDYTNNYNNSSLYYNPYTSTPNPNYTLQGNIYDNNMHPISDALIFVNSAFTVLNANYNPNDPNNLNNYKLFYQTIFSHSSLTGSFLISVKPPQNIILTDNEGEDLMNSIFNFQVSAPLAEFYERYLWSNNANNLSVASNINLNKNYSIQNISNQTVSNTNQIINSDTKFLIFDNTIFLSGNNSEYTASQEIVLSGESYINTNNELYLHLQPSSTICANYPNSNYNTSNFNRIANTFSPSKFDTKKNISLNFNLNQKEEIIIYPNPACVVANIISNESKLDYIKIINESGNLVFERSNVQPPLKIDFSLFARGSYIINIITGDKLKTKKIIIE
jgi:hypothetical protein